MCIRDRLKVKRFKRILFLVDRSALGEQAANAFKDTRMDACLLYTSDAADERSSVDLGGRRIITKKIHTHLLYC